MDEQPRQDRAPDPDDAPDARLPGPEGSQVIAPRDPRVAEDGDPLPADDEPIQPHQLPVPTLDRSSVDVDELDDPGLGSEPLMELDEEMDDRDVLTWAGEANGR